MQIIKALDGRSDAMKRATILSLGLSEADRKAAMELVGLSAAEGTATAATGGLGAAFKGLWATIAAHPLVATAAAIAAVVTAISRVHRKLQEARQEIIDYGKVASDESKKILDLRETYDLANAAYDGTTESKENLDAATKKLLQSLGIEEEEIDRLKKKYGDLSSAIDHITIQTLEEKQREMIDAVDAAESKLMHNFGRHSTLISYNNEDEVFFDKLKELGLFEMNQERDAFSDAAASYFYLSGNDSSPDGLLAAKDDAKELLSLLQTAAAELDVTQRDLHNTSIWKGLDSFINSVDEDLKQIELSRRNLADSIVGLNYAEGIQSGSKDYVIPKTTDEYYKLRDALIAAARGNEDFANTQQDAVDAVDRMLSGYSFSKEFASEINEFKHALNDSELDKTWADFFNRLAASKTDIDLARLIEPEFSANSGLQEWADKYGYTVDDIISHVQKLREEINKPAEDAGKAAAKTNKELISFSNRLKSLRVDIVKTLGQGKELTQEQTEEFYNWISAFDYLDGETKDIQQRAQEFLSMLAQYFSIKPEWEINDHYIKNMLRDAEEQYDSLRGKIESRIFGNIDLNNRQELHWDNDEIIAQYKDALLSWGQDLEEIKGSVSTVLGASSEFDGVEIAFSPILQTDSGAKLLSQGTVYDYVNAVLKEAAARNPNGDGWTTELAFEVDKEGLDIAGQHIQGLFADIGDTAMQSGELMHHVSMSIKGDSDALANAFGIAAENKYRAHESALAYIRNFVVNDIADLASLQDELKNTGKAWQEYQNLISGGDTGDTAKQMASAYQKAIEDLENGRFDTKAVWGAAKLLFSDEQLRDMEYDLVEVAKRLRSPMMQALFGKVGDGEDDYEIGVKFANQIRESIGILGDSAGIIDNGDGTFKFWYDSLGKLSKQLGMSEEAVSSLLEALSAYGVESMRSTEDNDALAEKFERVRSMAASADEAVREFARGLLSGGITENHVMDILENLSDAGVIDLDTSKLSDAVSWAVEDLKKLENEENTPKPDIDLSNLNAKKDEITAFKTFLDETLGNLKPYTISVQFDDETRDRLDRLARAGGFSTGTRNAPGGIALVNEKGPELISDGGEAYIANGGRPGFTNLSRGAVVFNAEETKQIFRRGYTNVPIKAFADGTSNTVDKASLRERLLGGKRVGGLFTGGVSKVFECGNCHHRWNYSPIDYPKGPTGFCPKCGARIVDGETYGGNTVDSKHTNDDYYEYNVSTGQAIENYDDTYENYYSDVFNNYKTCPNCGSRIQERYDVCPGCGYNFHIGKVPSRSTRANIRAAQSLPGSGAGRISGSGNNGYGGGNNGYGSGSVGPADYVNQADPQKTDWIAVLINRIQKSVSSLEKIASSGFKSLGTRTDAATMEISELYNQIAVQEQGYDRYMQEAYNVGLPGYIIDQIQNGTIDITEYDEETSAQIDKFSTWYEKALQCKEAVEDLHEKVAQLNLDIFQNTQQDFENQLSAIDHKMTMVDKIVDYNREFGRVSNMEYYQVATNLEAERIAKLNEELDTLNIKFQDAMSSGEIEECSEAWYSMTSAINSVEEAIVDAHRQMVQYRVDLFNNTQKDYENYLNLIEHRANMVGKRIEMEKLAGNLDSGEYYKALTGVESERIAALNQELVVLRQRFQEAMNSGEIAECSDAWYNMRFAINSVEEAIADAQYRMVEYRNTVFDYTQRTYENQLSLIDHQMNMASKRLEMAKLSGQVDNSSYYNSLASIESQRIGKLQQQMSAMGNMLIQAMNSGEIRKYSESWYRMITSINSVEEAIADAQIRMIGYGNSAQEAAAAVEEIGEKMHDIEWDYFDFAMEQYGRLQKEANFLIGVMSNDKLFEDNGTFSAKGEATLGLRVLNYNAFMTQAEAYKKEIEDKFSGTLTDKEEIDRRNTLIDLQQQSIQAAENEKNAIRDLVADGIQVEIKSMQELIDAYEKSLDSAKD